MNYGLKKIVFYTKSCSPLFRVIAYFYPINGSICFILNLSRTCYAYDEAIQLSVLYYFTKSGNYLEIELEWHGSIEIPSKTVLKYPHSPTQSHNLNIKLFKWLNCKYRFPIISIHNFIIQVAYLNYIVNLNIYTHKNKNNVTYWLLQYS